MGDKEQFAIERIKLAAEMSEAYYHKPALICYSGGKDSDVLLELARRAVCCMQCNSQAAKAQRAASKISKPVV